MRLHKGWESDSGRNDYSDLFLESDWPITFILRTQFTEHWSEEWAKKAGRYSVEIHAVSPEAAEKEIDNAIRSVSLAREEFQALPRFAQCEILLDYGVSACLWSKTGNNRAQLEREARKELKMICFLFGFYMDRPLNAIGNTGWDWIRGEVGFKPAAAED